jgi:hypothetical protein
LQSNWALSVTEWQYLSCIYADMCCSHQLFPAKNGIHNLLENNY